MFFPTVLGFYLLLLLSPQGKFGSWLSEVFGSPFPFPSRDWSLDQSSIHYLLSSSPLETPLKLLEKIHWKRQLACGLAHSMSFFSIALPLARPGILTGSVLGFAHTVGEFGVILMLGGNIPGETKVLSVAIYDYVESLQWEKAHVLAGGMIGFSFCVILATTLIERHWRAKR